MIAEDIEANITVSASGHSCGDGTFQLFYYWDSNMENSLNNMFSSDVLEAVGTDDNLIQRNIPWHTSNK